MGWKKMPRNQLLHPPLVGSSPMSQPMTKSGTSIAHSVLCHLKLLKKVLTCMVSSNSLAMIFQRLTSKSCNGAWVSLVTTFLVTCPSGPQALSWLRQHHAAKVQMVFHLGLFLKLQIANQLLFPS